MLRTLGSEFEYLQGWRLYNPSGQPVLLFTMLTVKIRGGLSSLKNICCISLCVNFLLSFHWVLLCSLWICRLCTFLPCIYIHWWFLLRLFSLGHIFLWIYQCQEIGKKKSAVNVSFMFQKQQTYWFKNWDFLKEFILLCHKILNISYLVTAVNIFYKPHSSNKIIYLLFCFVSDIREQIQYSWCHSKRQGSNYM